MITYLDMDGVIIDFLGGLHKALGSPYSYVDYPYKKGKWSMLTDIKVFDDIPVTFEECNDCCTATFWRRLEWMYDGLDIFTAVFNRFADDIYLLTTPMPNMGSWLGKAQWVNDKISVFNERLIISTAPKALLATPNTLLIDDKDENIEEFTAAGGQGILVPRPWNKRHRLSGETLYVVTTELGDMR